MKFVENLKCPITKNSLLLIGHSQFREFNITEEFGNFGKLNCGLIDQSRQYFYPIIEDIFILHEQYASFIGQGTDGRKKMSFDKTRVFNYYNELEFNLKDQFNIYIDSPKWVDFRSISSDYLKHSFSKASSYYEAEGEYLLDIASGPIGLTEYMSLSDGYNYRVCVDISINALYQAKRNIERAGKKGIYICGDICNIPIMDATCDTVLCQHTLYHIPKMEQHKAVTELYRVAKPESKIVIIYSWFWHSWFMNLSLNIVQLYRILRHVAGKLYVHLFHSKPRLYFYAHRPSWFRTAFDFSKNIEMFCWRSTNKYFLNIYIHKWLFGKQVLNYLLKIEDRYSKFMSRFGEYAVIVISKKE